MTATRDEFYSLKDLGIAYRKAKVDLYYSSRAARRDLLSFEGALSRNLQRLRSQLLTDSFRMPTGPDTWTIVPKHIEPTPGSGNEAESRDEVVRSDPRRAWELDPQKTVEFRMMESLPISFHVVATLWLYKIGQKLDDRLKPCVYGNRLRRNQQNEFNVLSLGSTKPYLHAYRRWRDSGMRAIRNGLAEDKSVIALTADIRAFYHNIDPRFARHPGFLESIGVDLDERESELHDLFIKSLVIWAEETPAGIGLPVGLTASAVLANLSLFDLDRIVEREAVPLYYGRYADDIILVMENGSEFDTADEMWDWLISRSDGALAQSDDSEISFSQPYLGDSSIHFSKAKTKAFFLKGQEGAALTAALEREIQRRTSEWRSMPELPDESESIEANLLTAIQKDGEPADSLGRTDRVSVRRAAFAIRVRNVEAFDRALSPEMWERRRHSFLDSFTRHVLVLPTFFDFFHYLERVVELACSCADFWHLRQMLNALSRIQEDLTQGQLSISGPAQAAEADTDEIRQRFNEELKHRVREAIEVSFPSQLSPIDRESFTSEMQDATEWIENPDLRHLQTTQRQYFVRDLARRPLKERVLPPSLVGSARLPAGKNALTRMSVTRASRLLPSRAVKAAVKLSQMANLLNRSGVSSGLLFPTRPPSMQDLYVLSRGPFTEEGTRAISTILLGLRGFSPVRSLPRKRGSGPKDPIEISCGRSSSKSVRIALASWKTDPKSWIAAATQMPDPDRDRFDRLNRLVNAALSCRKRPDYLVLPELALPPRWFLAVAGKLQAKGISLMSGIEYQHVRRRVVHNQVWAALSHDSLGFPATVIYRQDKLRPAYQEEVDLRRVGGRSLRPEVRWRTPSVVNHGDFFLAFLVCSELTNVYYRAALRGQIDALFVPEWNRDTTSFTSLVESTALDVHTYVVQCNDRQYGDSRIRAPMKHAWARDVVRVKGGIEDYLVTGEIDIDSLRRFQSGFRSPDEPFKPVPDGFEMSPGRRALPYT